MSKVLLITGKAQQGKDTSALLIKEQLEGKGQRVIILHYADFLKCFITQHKAWNGEKDLTGRTMLQYWGTDVVRKNNVNAWTNMVKELILGLSSEYDFFIVGDARFPNEISIMQDTFEQTIVIRVIREKQDGATSKIVLSQQQQEHSSETAADNYPVDYVLRSSTIDELQYNVTQLVQHII